ncbi:hypothetical protein RU95_GL003256 [Enterococcus avium]|nr:hypothetical protein RU95_GL003256 [Enterococcus avium]
MINKAIHEVSSLKRSISWDYWMKAFFVCYIILLRRKMKG